MTKVDVTQKADIRCVLGASGTGKSHYTKAEMAKAKRLLVWDMDDEYGKSEAPSRGAVYAIGSDEKLGNIIDLPRLLHAQGSGAFKLRVVPSDEQKRRNNEFDVVCKAVMITGKLLFVAEELKFVTQPSWAPPGWSAITLRGRKRGVKVIGTSQRPASIDKDFLGNATLIRCGALTFPEDRIAVAKSMIIDVAELEKLEGHQAILWTRTPRSIKQV